MRPPEPVVAFLARESYHLLRSIDLGTTARIHILEKDGQRYALKIAQEEAPEAPALRTEHRLLQHLNRSPMRPYVPRVHAWLPQLDGFLMAYLRYPTPAEKERATWIPDLARALRTLHHLDPPSIPGHPDDRPDVARAVTRRFRGIFDALLRADTFWAGLADRDRPKLARVRAHHRAYASLLPRVEEALASAPVALTHGDLAGDNVMVTEEAHPAIVDWGSARISAAWTDAASLATYSQWPPDERRRFYALYLADAPGAHRGPLRCLEILSRLHRYRSCVQSLLWLNQGRDGLDAVGRAYFENQLRLL